ncbi:adipocyte plasma membrane-associated protein-like isoform X2 [Dreissena polymorpha]|nr:adipocyte plasma membrane-associated protein-like isoform X2 [Dreissena polymorpha]XP_052275148.1 adipocyte plasma membrane-associated protein-like isoform X2 [Dreissena polymorpha]XP_052275150.1 adipocyte plasma membrane-associated protein-like isoform X2 [Dreissena polymorpha]
MSEGLRKRQANNKPRVVEQDVTEEKKYRQSIGWRKAGLISTGLTLIIFPMVLSIIPSPIDPVAYTLPPPPEWVGALAPNTNLQRATRLFQGEVTGPESIVVDGDYMYTGTADGRIMVIHKGHVRELTRLGRLPCEGFKDEPTCGRPLGMRMDRDGYLIVLDTYLGIFKVNVATGDKKWLSSVETDGHTSKFLNDLDIGPDGTYYISDSSTKWDRRHNRYLVMEGDATGRLLSYHPETNTTTVLATGIPFANGVQLTRDKQAILLTSTTLAAVYKYYIAGPKSGTLETFNNNLPGLPDNIRRSSKGGYWVGLASVRRPGRSIVDALASRPWLRQLIAKIFSQDAIIKLLSTFNPYGMVIHLNELGEITQSLHDPTGAKISAVSEVEDRDGVLYLGSYYSPFLSKLYLTDIKN